MNNLTTQQIQVVLAIQAGSSISVRSVAGSGKTSTLVAAHQTSNPPRTLCVAFNKRNAEDLAAKMPAEVTCKTFNAIGHATWQKFLGKFLKVDARKLWKIWNTNPHKEELFDDAQDIVKLARLAKVYGLAPGYGPTPKTQALPDFQLWEEIAEQHDIEEAQTLLPHAVWLLVESNKAAYQGEIDWEDQIYCPVIYDAPFEKYDRVSVDEVQDLSQLQHEIVSRLVKPGGQIVSVGDPDQSCYFFRGADANSFELMEERFHLERYKLTVSFRCAEAICKEARKYVPDIESGTGREGRVIVHQGPLHLSKSLCVLSRTNAPLIRMAFDAIKQGVPVNLVGRDFMGGLRDLNRKYSSLTLLEGWKRRQLEVCKSLSAKQKVEDRYSSMLAIHARAKEKGATPASCINELMQEAKDGQSLTLSSIHKAKGSEFQNVAYFNSNKNYIGPQERELKYIATTRAIENLTLNHVDTL